MPYFENVKVTVKAFFFYSGWAIWPIMHVFFIQKITETIEIKDKEEFIYMITMYLITLAVYYIFSFIVRNWWYITSVSYFRKTIHDYYLQEFIKISNNEAEKTWTGKLISIIWTGMDTWTLLLDKTIENVLKVLFTVVFTIYMIGTINIWASVIFIVLYILIHIVWEYFNRKSLMYRRNRQELWNSYTWWLVKVLMSKFEILQTWQIGRELENINEVNYRMLNETKKMAIPHYWFYYIPSMFINIVKILTFVFLGYQVILWNTTFSVFIALFGILTIMNNVIINSMIFYSDFTNNFTKVEKMWDFFDNTEYIEWYESWDKFKHKSGEIRLKNVTFWYNKRDKVFEDFSLKIQGEKVTALVWNSWWWKSTLVKLISWYIEVNSWEILIDGQDLKDLSLKSYYKEIWYLTQEPSVFDGTILENLTYATWKEIGEDRIEKAIKMAKCEFIEKLPHWINTEIWERGIKLSWWQRQRLAIAKIFLKDPKIIILDEPTSALDSFSEELITKAMHNLFKWRTVIIIAHRLQTVKHADKIFVIEWGKVVEEWDHKELVKKKGIYKRMLDLQSGF